MDKGSAMLHTVALPVVGLRTFVMCDGGGKGVRVQRDDDMTASPGAHPSTPCPCVSTAPHPFGLVPYNILTSNLRPWPLHDTHQFPSFLSLLVPLLYPVQQHRFDAALGSFQCLSASW
jgi:hypothetical protein